MSSAPTSPEQTNKLLVDVLEGVAAKNNTTAEQAYKALHRGFGLPEVQIEDNLKGVPISDLQDKAVAEDGAFLEETYGNKHAFLAAAAAGPAYKEARQEIKSVDDMTEKSVIDESVVGAASPIAVDPQIVSILRGAAPVLDRITQQSQAGFTAQYNVISARSDPIGMVSESDAVDLSGQADGDFTLTTAQKDMKIYVDKVNISDYTQRAENSLGYMDVTQTTLGQRTTAHALFKAKQIFYGDPSVGEANGSVEDANAYEGLAKIANDAGNNVDKSGTSANFLEDLKLELTKQVEETGLTYDSAEFFVSPEMFDTLENEANPTVRLDSYDEGINFGGRSIQIKGVRVTECPNIRNYSDLSGTNFTSDEGDVFLVDTSAVQFRSLAPLSTVPLARNGLSDRAAMFEYGTLIDKSQGEHTLYLSGYAI